MLVGEKNVYGYHNTAGYKRAVRKDKKRGRVTAALQGGCLIADSKRRRSGA